MSSRRKSLIVIFGAFFGCIVAGDVTRAGPEWSVEDQVAEMELSPSSQLLSVRYEGENEFSRVEQGIVKSAVEGLSFHVRRLPLAVFLVERADEVQPDVREAVKNALYGIPKGTQMVCRWNTYTCRSVCDEIGRMPGSVFVELPLGDEDRWRIKYPDGQIVTISDQGAVVDFGEGPELLTFFGPGSLGEDHQGPREEMSGVNFLGAREFTLVEFFEPASKRVISRNVVTEVLFD
jgi:hypothetical protein